MEALKAALTWLVEHWPCLLPTVVLAIILAMVLAGKNWLQSLKLPKTVQEKLYEYWVALAVVALLLVECLVFLNPLPGLGWKAACLAAACGAGVAMTEIISRYRDEPWLAVVSPFGVVYCLLNSGVSLAVFGVVVKYGDSLGFATTLDSFWKSLAAGFGGTAVLRTRFAVVKGKDNSDISLGLDYVVQTFLGMVDRYIDRARAAKRLALATTHTSKLQKLLTRKPNPLSFDEIADRLLVKLNAFQNLTPQEKTDLARLVAEYRSQPLADDMKLMALSFLYLSCVGEDQFGKMVEALSSVEAPAVEAPAVEAPAVEAPAVEAPAVEAPAVEAPAVEAPAVEAPAVEAQPTKDQPEPTDGLDKS